MKKFFKLTLYLLAFAAVFSSLGAEALLSPAIELLRREDALTKQCDGGAVYFSAEEFDTVAGEAAEELLLCSLPSVSDGVLKIAGLDALPGQRINASALPLLKFVPSKGFSGEAAFTFSVNGGAESRCVIRYSEQRNLSPVVADSAVETYGGVCVLALLDCHDPEGDELSFKVERWPAGGSLYFENGCAVYCPVDGFFGVDVFSYVAVDSAGNRSDSAEVTVTVAKAAPIRFADMEENSAGYAAVRLAADGVMGYTVMGGECYFLPEKTVSRLEFAMMLMAATETPLPEKEFPTEVFTDTAGLSAEELFCVEAAVISGIVEVDGDCFRPNDPITADEAAAMASRAGFNPAVLPEDQKFMTNSLTALLLTSPAF